MDAMTVRQKRVVLGMVTTCVTAVAVAAFDGRRQIQLEYWRWQAARECGAESDLPDEMPPPHLRLLQDSGEDGYPYLLKLLKDPDEEVLRRIARVPESYQEEFLAYLRRTDRLAALSFLYQLGVRRFDADWYGHWSGQDGVPLDPFPEGIDFLESKLREAWPENYRGTCFRIATSVDALAAMLRPGEVRTPGSPLAARIVELLARVATTESFPGLRLFALNHMVIRSEPATSWKEQIDPARLPISVDGVMVGYPFTLPSLADWHASISPIGAANARGAFLALCHLDSELTPPILTRLINDPGLRLMLKAFLAERPRLGPLEMPQWVIAEADGKATVRLITR